MHPAATDMIVKEVRQRISEGDCPTVPARSVEQLESVIEDLAGRLDAALTQRPFIHDRTREAQRRLDASVTPEQAAEDVRRMHEVAAERKRYEEMSTAERCLEQGDGFINDYD